MLFLDGGTFVYEYWSNTIPLPYQYIIVEDTTVKAYYHVKYMVFKPHEQNTITVSVELITQEINESNTQNYTGTTVSQQTNSNSSTRERPKGEVDPNQNN